MDDAASAVAPFAVLVECEGRVLRFALDATATGSFGRLASHVAAAFRLSAAPRALLAVRGDARAAAAAAPTHAAVGVAALPVAGDAALRAEAAAAHPAPARLVVPFAVAAKAFATAPDADDAPPPPLLTVEHFMRTVLAAVLDTPVAKRELAALFLAASGAWEHAVRENGWRRGHGLVVEAATAGSSASAADAVVGTTAPTGVVVLSSPPPALALSSSSAVALPATAISSTAMHHDREGMNSSTYRAASVPGSTALRIGTPTALPSPVHLCSVLPSPRTLSGEDAAVADGRPSGSHPTPSVRSSAPAPAAPGTTPCPTPIPRPASPDRAVVRDILRSHHCTGGDPGAEQRALACFCTHPGFTCSGCQSMRIEGPRFVCTSYTTDASISLCAKCRHTVHISDECYITVYDHPWEADEEYMQASVSATPGAQDFLKVPRAPLSLGDRGPRVMHLHYVLYKMGYLRLSNRALTVGEFCEETRNTVARYQRDHQLLSDGSLRSPSPALLGAGGTETGDQPGVFTSVTRRAILNLIREVEMRYSLARCRSSRSAEAINLLTATAA
jgi:hypothetical protein